MYILFVLNKEQGIKHPVPVNHVLYCWGFFSFPKADKEGSEEIIDWEVLKCELSSKAFCCMLGAYAFAEIAPPVADKLGKEEETYILSHTVSSQPDLEP